MTPIHQLLRAYLSLPYHKKVQVMANLGLEVMSMPRSEEEKDAVLASHVASNDLQARWWDEVKRAWPEPWTWNYGDVNPFVTIVDEQIKPKPIEVIAGGLQCDAEGCDYKDDTPTTDYAQCINKPCPKCGANLLTQEDYEAFQATTSYIEMLNKILPAPEPGDKEYVMQIHHHAGTTDITIKLN